MTDSEVSNANLLGARGERWADKSIISVVYANGRLGGVSEVSLNLLIKRQSLKFFQHSAYDGIASITMMHYCLLAVNARKGGWPGQMHVRDLLKFEELKFELNSELRSEIRRVTRESFQNVSKVFFLIGKGFSNVVFL